MQILIVDDDAAYARMVDEWLKDTYQISIAISADQVFSFLKKHKPDLILLDYDLPVMPGPQVLERLRDDPETGDIPVMFLTGHTERESIMRVLSMNPADYLLKTITKEEIRGKLETFFANRT